MVIVDEFEISPTYYHPVKPLHGTVTDGEELVLQRFIFPLQSTGRKSVNVNKVSK